MTVLLEYMLEVVIKASLAFRALTKFRGRNVTPMS